jgi:predicted RNase H-like HicB family nuclease
MFQYSINMAWSDDDGGYIATVAELPGLSGFGETPDEAVKEVMEAVKLTIEVMEEDGEQPPEPRKLIAASGQIRLRMPKSLHRALAIEAQREGVSLNTHLLSLIQGSHAKERAYNDALAKLKKHQPLEAACPIRLPV